MNASQEKSSPILTNAAARGLVLGFAVLLLILVINGVLVWNAFHTHALEKSNVSSASIVVLLGLIGVIVLLVAHQLNKTLRHLAHEMREREQAHNKIAELNRELEQRVEARTVELNNTIEHLREAESRVRAAHHESKLFIDAVPSILIGLNSEGEITRWNDTAVGIFGLSEQDVLGKPFLACGVHWVDDGLKEEVKAWSHFSSLRKYDRLKFENRGQLRMLGLTVKPIQLSSHTTAALVTGADVTDRCHLEEQLKQAQKLEGIGQLAAGVAHEINTPIQYIGDNTTFIKQTWNAIGDLVSASRDLRAAVNHCSVAPAVVKRFDDCWELSDMEYAQQEVPRAIDQTLEGVSRVAKIVKAMKEFSHPGMDEKKLVDINHAIETTVTVARNEWKYVANVDLQLNPDLPQVPCLGAEFNQVILNLLVNAAHAIAATLDSTTDAKGKITISTRLVGDAVELAIKDSGAGIPPEIRDRVFEPFFTTKEVGKGTGQGLALAHATIVKKHGGRIWFESECGKGTTFFIHLPLHCESEKV